MCSYVKDPQFSQPCGKSILFKLKLGPYVVKSIIFKYTLIYIFVDFLIFFIRCINQNYKLITFWCRLSCLYYIYIVFDVSLNLGQTKGCEAVRIRMVRRQIKSSLNLLCNVWIKNELVQYDVIKGLYEEIDTVLNNNLLLGSLLRKFCWLFS